ncbi:AAA family ATPase [Bacillus pseudomycoides]|uniref:AAA family ATPase n=1 Tax=Bacillus pseudomycoides TaxID=64104 RepID=UPI000BF176B3|nr:AAA family ATPase [Bacillus pseudomycoides]PEL25826.1 hypothetical protein CN608_13830 [Bacillus pseudomycoides]
MTKIINAIFFKKINNGDLWNIDRPPGSVAGGGGQTYINVAVDTDSLHEFMSGATSIVPKPGHIHGNSTYTVIAKSLHDSTQTGPIVIDPRNNRTDYRITQQALHQNRHPAWLNANTGFPVINRGATSANTTTTATNLRIFIIRTTDNEYYAGYVNSANKPTTWSNLPSLDRIFTEDSGIIFFEEYVLNTEANELFRTLMSKTNLLLYGPPGTGKTYAMQNLWKDLCNAQNLYLNENNMGIPFIYDKPIEYRGFRNEWVTFHQNYSYEEFVLGKQIIPIPGGGFTLKPKLGVFMDVAASISPRNQHEKAIIFIDELNRGNVSRIFGQLITFLESNKRETDSDGNENAMRLPVPLNDLITVKNATEITLSLDGTDIQLPVPYYLPYPIYIIASMNSVDRAVAPLDSALARRFNKIEYATDYNVLCDVLGVNEATINYSVPTSWDASTIAYILLKKLNNFIATYFGKDFEFGHVHLLSIREGTTEDDKIFKLRECWEGTIYPQLASLLLNRAELLFEFLKVEEPMLPPYYPYRYRTIPAGTINVLDNSNTYDINTPDEILDVFRIIAQ